MPAIRRIAPETVEELRRLFLEVDADGAPMHKVESIASDLDVSVCTVIAHTRDLPRRLPWQEKKRRAILELSDDGLDVAAIAARLNVPVSVVLKALPRPTKPQLDADEQKARYAAKAKERYAAMTPEQRAARLEYLRQYHARRKASA